MVDTPPRMKKKMGAQQKGGDATKEGAGRLAIKANATKGKT